ncbi:MAG: hypothetical protein KKB20_23960, partial [Proteobacteria bacterium]|nr:hypothetical protein [Pseudomonadota bacterium]
MMKKILASALGVLLVAALAGSAAAATKFSFSGKYMVRGFWDSNNDLGPKWDGGSETVFGAGTIIAPVDMNGRAVGATAPVNAAAVVGAWVRLDDGTVKFIDERLPGAKTAGGVPAGVPTSSESYTDGYMDHQLEINMQFMPSDKLTLNVQLNALKEQMWGHNQANKSWGGANAGAGADDPEFHKVWMTIRTSFGVFDIGRQDSGVSGSQVFGSGASAVGAPRYWGNSRFDGDRFRYMLPISSNFFFFAVWDRLAEGNGRFIQGGGYPAVRGRLTNNPHQTYLAYRDQQNLDVDAWTVLPLYQWATGAFLVQVTYMKSEAAESRTTLPNNYGALFTAFQAAAPGVLPAGGPAAATWRYAHLNAKNAARRRDLSWTIRPALRLNFGPLEFNADIAYQTGTREYYKPDKDDNALIMAGRHPLYPLGAPPAGGNIELKDQDIEGRAYYFDVQYKYGPGTIGLLYAYHQGDNDANDDTLAGQTGCGQDFKPLYAAFGKYTDYSLYAASNFWMWSAWVDHSLTEDLILHAAYGYMR